MAIGFGGVRPSGWRPSYIAAAWARSNQRASSNSPCGRHDHRRGGAREEADHQRGGERPGLGGGIRRARRPAMLVSSRDLADDRVFESLAGLDEAGQARIHAFGKARRAAEQTALAVDRQHDDDGIGAGKMLGLARVALAPPARRGGAGRRAAARAEAIARVPVEQRLRLAERGQRLARDQPLHGDAPQRDQLEVAPPRNDERAPIVEAVARVGDLLDRLVAEREGEDRRAARPEAEQDLGARAAERRRFGEREQRVARARALRQERRVAREQRRARIAPSAQGRDRRRVVAQARGGGRASSRRSRRKERGARVLKKASFIGLSSGRRALLGAAPAGRTRLKSRANQPGPRSEGEADLDGLYHDKARRAEMDRGGARRLRIAPVARLRRRGSGTSRPVVVRRSRPAPRLQTFAYVNPDAPKGGLLSAAKSPPPAATRTSTPSTPSTSTPKKGDGAAGMSATFDALMAGQRR